MTDKLREAAQQALEALVQIHPANMTPMAEEAWNKAIVMLGDALAEQPAEQEPVAQRWQPIETAPKGRIVLVYYKNSLGNGRTMRARYYLPETLDSDTTESGWADEGWYEESEAYEYLMPLEHDPTHWMPLPAGPDTAPQPAKSAEQEPVAWLDEEKKIIYWHNTHETDDYHGFKRTKPLYTAPQPAIPPGYKLVPASALQWLFGEAGEFECPTNRYFRGNPAPYWWRSVFRELIESAPDAPQPAKPAEQTDSYVQQVPDKCDRIVWRNSYYHLPLRQPAEQASENPDEVGTGCECANCANGMGGCQMEEQVLSDDGDALTIAYLHGFAEGKKAAPQPAKRVPLTDDEIDVLWAKQQTKPFKTHAEDRMAFARAVIAAYDAKNGITGETK